MYYIIDNEVYAPYEGHDFDGVRRTRSRTAFGNFTVRTNPLTK